MENPAAIPKSGLEIQNRCTKEGVNGEKLTSIPKSGLEIKNRCTKEGVNGENLQRFASLALKSRIDARKQPIPQHAFHNALTTRLTLDVLH